MRAPRADCFHCPDLSIPLIPLNRCGIRGKNVVPDMTCWTVGAPTLHFVKLQLHQRDTSTVTGRCVPFAKLMCLLYGNQKARLILGKSAMSPLRKRGENI